MRILKKVLCILIILSMLLFSGCKKVETPTEQNDSTEFDTASVNTSLIHGFPSGLWFMLSTAIAESLNRSYSESLIQTLPGESTENLYRLENSSAEFALTHSSSAYGAVNGIGSFEKQFTNLSGICVFYPSAAQLVVKKKVGATSFSDFIENKIPLRISIGVDPSTANTAFSFILAEYGLTVKDLEDWGCKIYLKNMSDSGELFNDGLIDGIFVQAGAPTNAVVQMAINTDMVMLNIDDEIITAMSEKYGYGLATISADDYSFVTEDTPTFVTYTILAAAADTSDETAYKMAKSLHENLDYISTVHGALKRISPEVLVIYPGIPLHPGAEKYYRETGLID